MKKATFRVLAICLIIAILLPIIAGCRADEGEFDTPEFVFVAETVTLPDNITDVRNLAYFDDTLYFWSTTVIDGETGESVVNIYSMNIDGSNLMPLPNYSLPASPSPDAQSNFHIMGMFADDEGFLWVAEQGSFFRLNVPDDFDGEDWDRWNYWEDLGSVTNIRKLDNTGAEVLSVDLSILDDGSGWISVNAFNIDGAGNLFVASNDRIVVMDSNAVMQFQLDVDQWVDRLFRMPSGDVAFFGWTGEGMALRVIDPVTRSWGETIDLPNNAWQIFPGDEEHFLLFQDGSNLFGIETETGESVRLINWLDSNLSTDGLENIVMLADGRVLCTTSTWNRRTMESTFELNVLTKTPYSELPERTVITLATVSPWGIRNAVIQFNRTNPTYRIHVIDYSEFNTDEDWTIAITRLSTDMIAGRVPDIIDLSQLPFEQYVARGLLVDLYPLIDADPDIRRIDLIESVLRASELDGGLYRMFSSFGINTLIGHPSVIGPDIGWTMEEFLATLDANPQADRPLGGWLTRSAFLESTITINMSDYVDWVAGESHFDTPEFAQLLEIASRFPEDFDRDGDMGFMMEGSNLIAEGRQIMMATSIWDFQSVLMNTAMFGGDIVYKGFPSNNGNGNSLFIESGLAITSSSPHQDAAWQFMRELLTTDWQTENIQFGFPINRIVFDRMIEEAMEEPEWEGSIGWGMGETVDMRAMTRAEVDAILNLIDTADGVLSRDIVLMDLINESAEDFFAGRQSAAETARIIQSRVSRYVQEQS
ncbi:MAG: extracellular solute-binding protein [Oscillospiraceae bacterium]|nr:extracellular solute-binding protein [Oscillospiraceae bacterium]